MTPEQDWAILGALVTVNLLLERRGPAARTTATGGWWARHEPLKVISTFFPIVTLWSLWNSTSVAEWLDLVTWWKVG